MQPKTSVHLFPIPIRTGRGMTIAPHLLSRLQLRRRALIPHIRQNNRRHPNEPDRPRDHPVSNLPLDRVGTQHQSQAPVDDARGQYHPAPPDVGGAPGAAALVFLVDGVLDEAADGLEREGADYDDADYGVAVCGCELDDAWGGLLVFQT